VLPAAPESRLSFRAWSLVRPGSCSGLKVQCYTPLQLSGAPLPPTKTDTRRVLTRWPRRVQPPPEGAGVRKLGGSKGPQCNGALAAIRDQAPACSLQYRYPDRGSLHPDELPDRLSLQPQPDKGAALCGFKTGLCRTRTGILPHSGLPASESAMSTAP
jgi:hypothetical protein